MTLLDLHGRYGLKHAYLPIDILRWNPSFWPFRSLTPDELSHTIVRLSFHFALWSHLSAYLSHVSADLSHRKPTSPRSPSRPSSSCTTRETGVLTSRSSLSSCSLPTAYSEPPLLLLPLNHGSSQSRSSSATLISSGARASAPLPLRPLPFLSELTSPLFSLPQVIIRFHDLELEHSSPRSRRCTLRPTPITLLSPSCWASRTRRRTTLPR